MAFCEYPSFSVTKTENREIVTQPYHYSCCVLLGGQQHILGLEVTVDDLALADGVEAEQDRVGELSD